MSPRWLLMLIMTTLAGMAHGWGGIGHSLGWVNNHKTRCPDHTWKHFGDVCIKAFSDHSHKTWAKARHFCKQQHPSGDLVIIHNAAMNHAVRSVMSVNHAWYWIGASDIQCEGKFRFVNGKLLSSYQPWARHQPDDHLKSEDCVEMAQSHGQWNDQNCHHGRFWVCQVNCNGGGGVINPPSPVKCPDLSWKKVDGICIKAYHHIWLSWFGAIKYCQKHHRGSLVKINSVKMNHAVTSLLNKCKVYWTAINDLKRENRFVFAAAKHPIHYTNWDSHQPDNYGSSEDCAVINSHNGRWNDYNCKVKTLFVCQVIPNQPLPEVECPKGWKLIGPDFARSCVKIYHMNCPWAKGRQICQKHGGDLVQIRNNQENHDIVNLLHSHKTYWIGIYDSNNDRKFELLDNTLATFFHWSHGEPNNQGRKENCLEIYSNGKWNDLGCHHLRNFVCQRYDVQEVN